MAEKRDRDYTDCLRAGCFAHTKEDTCRVLTDTRFGERECPFYKTGAQLAEERAASKARLRRLKAGGMYKEDSDG